jgi:hypothetical protein
LVVVGNRFDAGGLLDAPSTPCGAAAPSERPAWLHSSVCRTNSLCACYLHFWLRLHYMKPWIAHTPLSICGHYDRVVCLVLLHSGTRPLAKSIDWPGSTPRNLMTMDAGRPQRAGQNAKIQ